MLRKLLRIFVKSLLVIAAFAGVLAAYVYYITSPVVAVADRFMRDVASGDAKGAYALLTDAAKGVTSEAAFEQLVGNPALRGLKDVRWSSRSMKSNKGVGSGETEGAARLASGETMEIRMEFTALNDVWKVNVFNMKLAK